MQALPPPLLLLVMVELAANPSTSLNSSGLLLLVTAVLPPMTCAMVLQRMPGLAPTAAAVQDIYMQLAAARAASTSPWGLLLQLHLRWPLLPQGPPPLRWRWGRTLRRPQMPQLLQQRQRQMARFCLCQPQPRLQAPAARLVDGASRARLLAGPGSRVVGEGVAGDSRALLAASLARLAAVWLGSSVALCGPFF